MKYIVMVEIHVKGAVEVDVSDHEENQVVTSRPIDVTDAGTQCAVPGADQVLDKEEYVRLVSSLAPYALQAGHTHMLTKIYDSLAKENILGFAPVKPEGPRN